MKELCWLNDHEFTIGDLRFLCTLDDYSAKTDERRFILLKARSLLDNYARLLADLAPRTMLEFGIFQGGSPALFSHWFGLDRFVGIDRCTPVAAFDEFCRTHEAGKNIRSYYGVSQSDHPRIEQIIRTEFGATPLDVVIDDASHLYGLTKRSFEIAFPYLRPGGIYVIEDWGWAHWPRSRFFMGETALSMLIMELGMLCASRSDLVSEVQLYPAQAFIRKSKDAPPISDIRLDSLYSKRGIALVGARNPHLGDVARVLAHRAAASGRRKLQRLRKRLHRKT
jgi:hypothetical protein